MTGGTKDGRSIVNAIAGRSETFMVLRHLIMGLRSDCAWAILRWLSQSYLTVLDEQQQQFTTSRSKEIPG